MEKNEQLISFTLNGKIIECEESENLVKAAINNGVYIPTLCYFDHIDPAPGTCRVCTVKVNGKFSPGCQIKVKSGMTVETDSAELKDNRKAIVEILFTEGNHICPLCEKSGKCELQAQGYDMHMENPRFSYTYPERKIDYRPKHILMEHHRCILCRRCVEDVITDDGHKVFYFQQRGKDTYVGVDYEQEAKLSYEQAKRAMEICPVGTILLKEDTIEFPGVRKYDHISVSESNTGIKNQTIIKETESAGPVKKKVVATASLAGCFGCHMSMLDIDLGLMHLIDLVEFNRSPFTDFKTPSKFCDIALIEGGCCSDENVEVLKQLRENSNILVSVGACAINGNLPALRNWMPLDQVMQESYLQSPTSDASAMIPGHEDIPKILNRVYPCHEVVKMDYYIPGCPPGSDHIWKVVQNILFGTDYNVPYDRFKYD